jgi:hypothetical protein
LVAVRPPIFLKSGWKQAVKNYLISHRDDIFRVHQPQQFARQTVPLQFADEKLGVSCLRCIEKTIWSCLNILKASLPGVQSQNRTVINNEDLVSSCPSYKN